MFVCHFLDPDWELKKKNQQNNRTLILGIEASAAH